MKIGIIGVGKLATALVHGLVKINKATNIVLSPRNKANSQGLSNCYQCVTVAKNNQAVVDECDWIFLTLPTAIAANEIEQLTFKANTPVISCISTLSRGECQQLVGHSVPVYKAFPLPSVAQCIGPLAYYPHDTQIETFLSGLGQLFPCKDEAAFDPLASVTSLIASHYSAQATVTSWLVQNDIESTAAKGYLNSLTGSLTVMAEHQPNVDFSELTQDALTPGGLNEQVMKRLGEQGVCRNISASLDAVLNRLQQKS